MAVHGPYQALGTVWLIESFEPTSETAVGELVQRELETFEQMFSRFRANSKLSQLNQTGCLTNPDELMVFVLQDALAHFETTDGVFNIAVGERLLSLGYDADYSFTPQPELPTVPSLSEVLTVSENEITLTGGALDIGGFGKGVAIDMLVVALKEQLGLTQVLVNGGGDVFVTSEADASVTISLVHPTESDQAIGEVALRDQGFAASSPYLRRWPDGNRGSGKTHNHLMSESGVASYVVAPSAALADVWATTLAINPECEPPADVQCLLVQNNRVIKRDAGFVLFG